jgi:hypothetical protein
MSEVEAEVRTWSIKEQSFREPATGFLVEATPAIDDSGEPTGAFTLNIWNEGRTRKLVLLFSPDGWFGTSTVEAMSGAGHSLDQGG